VRQQRRRWRHEFASSNRSILAFVVLIAGLALGWMTGAPTLGRAAEALQRLEITSANGAHVFQVELARTGPEREKGLMFRRYLPKDRGMLFDFGSPEPATMWMENTILPLDMLFIRADGSIARVETHTEPFSRRVIASGEPVLGVLELNSGICDELGIKAGDKVSHPMFKPQ
jgi:uncharacterized protein